MKRHCLSPVLGASVLLVAAGVAAQPSAQHSEVTLSTSPAVPEVSVFVCPSGGGSVLATDCYGFGGITVSATIHVIVREDDGTTPVADLPQGDVRIQQDDSPMAWCLASPPVPPHVPNCADSPTTPDGYTTFTLNYYGGGHDEDGLQVWINEP
jgi:hypothetical protein